MDLSRLSPAPGATRKRKRIGRGPGSGHGKTSGRGHKGRGSRAGGNTPAGYEGGQMPLQRRLPKRGFHNPFRREFSIVNLGQLQECFEAGAIVDRDALRQHGLLRHKSLPIKVLAKGELTKAMTVKADQFSGTARQRLEAVGGTAEVTGA